MEKSNKNKDLIKGVSVYAIGTFGTRILSFLIVPLYTYYIATNDMGIYDMIMSTISLLTPIITMQISDAAYRWIIRDDVEDKAAYIRAAMQVLIVNCTIAIGIIFLINYIHPISYCLYFSLILVLSRAFQTAQKLLRGLKNQVLFAVSGLVYTIVLLSLNVIQLCILDYGVESLYQSAVIANAVALIMIIICEPRLRIRYTKRTDLKLIQEMYRYSIPLVPNYLNWWVINSSDRFIVWAALGSASNGILAIAHKFPSVLQSVLGLFTNAWQDVAIADTETNTGEYYTKIFRKLYRISLTGLCVIMPLTKIIIKLIMSTSYKSAGNFVAFYYMGTVFQFFSAFYGVGYLRNKETKKAFSTSVYGAIVNAFVNIALIKFVGLQAAAVSTFIGFLVMWLLRERQNRNELGIVIKWMEITSLTVCCVIIAILSNCNGLPVNGIILGAATIFFVLFNQNDMKLVFQKLKKMIRAKTKKRN